MITGDAVDRRELKREALSFDLVIVGGGMAGVCGAVTAARAGLRVALVQDRPVLGGNASSEVRLWVLGATSHMGNNNRWAREGGVIDEILVENTWRNPEGNPLIFDTVLLEIVSREPNITLLLNTAVHDVAKSGPDTIAAVRAFCSQNSTVYDLSAPLFCDASGDGIVAFMAGAAFRMGAEAREEFGEGFAPPPDYGQLLGHSIYFYSKDTGRPVRFVPPAFALMDIAQVPRWRTFNARDFGCRLWWIEYGGRRDTVHDTEAIKWELWRVVYGVWNHIKNSGNFPEAETMTLEWVGTIPGKRESRRFEGDYILRQQDLVEQRRHEDAVSFGGWSIDLHPADGVYSDKPGCNQWHSKGVFQIPYRCMFSRNMANLFLAGRIISASHVAFGSTRVMGTCAHGAQAVAIAAALCTELGLRPRDLLQPELMWRLQRDLLRTGQHIPGVDVADEEDLTAQATITASSTLALNALPPGAQTVALDDAVGMLVPLGAGPAPAVSFWARAEGEASVTVQLRTCSREESFTPDVTLAEQTVTIPAGAGGALQRVTVRFDAGLPAARYGMVCLLPAPGVAVALSDMRCTGVLSIRPKVNIAVAKSAVQTPPPDIGVDAFEFWFPERRPGGKNVAMAFDPPLRAFAAGEVARGPERPTSAVNAWAAAADDERPWVELRWAQPRRIARVVLCFDTDFDHPMESVLMGHPETRMPFCAPGVRLLDGAGTVLATLSDNHQTRREVALRGVMTDILRVEVDHPIEGPPAALFRVRVFG